MHLNSELLFRKYLAPEFRSGMKILEVGPDCKDPNVFRKLAGIESAAWETIDMEKTYPELTYVAADEYTFPIEDGRYDIVFSSSVIEHVRKVWVWITELARVTKPGGKVLTISPISWPYHGVPYDCWRIYPEGMKALYEEAGLEVETSFFETLEGADLRRDYPWKTAVQGQGLRSRLKAGIKKAMGWPATYAVDLVTIGTKKQS